MGHCTLPKIFRFKNWFEREYGDLCRVHDFMYASFSGKLRSDVQLFRFMWRLGRWHDYPMAIGAFLAVQLPWVWAEYLIKKKKAGNGQGT
jgi:hypothetical protein